MKKNEMKKGLTLIEFLFGIIIIAVIGLGGYIIYDKVIKEQPNVEEPANPDDQQQTEKPTEPEKPDRVETISLNDKIVTDLLDKYNLEGYAIKEFYTDKNITEDYIPNDFILGFTGGVAVRWQEGIDKSNTCGVEFSLKEGDFDSLVERFFGDVNYKHETFSVFNYLEDGDEKYFSYDTLVSGVATYVSNEYMFCMNSTDGYNDFIYQIPYQAEMVNDGEKINIYFKAFFVESYGSYDTISFNAYGDYDSYKNKDASGLVDDRFCPGCIDDSNLLYSYFGQLDSYAYSFKKQSDGSYYLSGFKKVD